MHDQHSCDSAHSPLRLVVGITCLLFSCTSHTQPYRTPRVQHLQSMGLPPLRRAKLICKAVDVYNHMFAMGGPTVRLHGSGSARGGSTPGALPPTPLPSSWYTQPGLDLNFACVETLADVAVCMADPGCDDQGQARVRGTTRAAGKASGVRETKRDDADPTTEYDTEDDDDDDDDEREGEGGVHVGASAGAGAVCASDKLFARALPLLREAEVYLRIGEPFVSCDSREDIEDLQSRLRAQTAVLEAQQSLRVGDSLLRMHLEDSSVEGLNMDLIWAVAD